MAAMRFHADLHVHSNLAEIESELIKYQLAGMRRKREDRQLKLF